MDSWVIEIQTPDGIWTDITELVDKETLGGFSYGIEDSLLQFRTGDMTLRLHNNRDGAARALFDGADPTLTYRLRVVRNDVKLFEGIVELPGQVNEDTNEAAVELSAYGYLALLDKLSAENVKRSFVADAVQGTADGTTLEFQTTLPTRFLQAGDQLRISSDVDSEEVTVLNGNGGSIIDLVDPLSNTWTYDDSYCELITPYHRRRTITFLVQALFYEAGIQNPTIDMVGTEFAVPVATPINTDGLDLSKTPVSINEIQGRLRVRTEDLFEYDSVDAAAGEFAEVATYVGGSLNRPIVDWHLYQSTEPAVADNCTTTTGTGGGLHDFAGVDYSLSPPRAWIFQERITVGGGGALTHHWELQYRDWQPATHDHSSATTVIADTATTNDDTTTVMSADFDSLNGLIWFSYEIPGVVQKLRVYDVNLLTFADIRTDVSGLVRYSRVARLLLFLSGTTLTVYDGTEIKTVVEVPTGLLLKSMRYLKTAKKWVGILRHRDRTQLLVADKLFTTIQQIDFADSASGVTHSTNEDSNNFLMHFQDKAVGMVDGQYVVIDTMYAGVVEYADFEGRTVAGALVELAKLVNCVVYVDHDFNGYFISRGSRIFNPESQPLAIDDLILKQDEDVVWDKWFGRVKVTTPDGRSLTVGDASQASAELEIDSNLVPNLSVQHALGIAYEAYYSVARRARNVTIDDNETQYRPLQRVTIGTDEWRVYNIDANPVDRESRLELVESDPEVGEENPELLGPELVRDGGGEAWTGGDDLTEWYEFYPGVVAANVTTPYAGTSSIALNGDGVNAGWIYSRPGHTIAGAAGTGKGPLYIRVRAGATYRVSFAGRINPIGPDLKWTLALFNNATDAFSVFFGHGAVGSGAWDGFFAGDSDGYAGVYPRHQGCAAVGYVAGTWVVDTLDIPIVGSGISGSYWMAIMFFKSSNSNANTCGVDAISIREVLSA